MRLVGQLPPIVPEEGERLEPREGGVGQRGRAALHMVLLELLEPDAPPTHPPPLEAARRAHQQRHAHAWQRQALCPAEERVVRRAARAVEGQQVALRLQLPEPLEGAVRRGGGGASVVLVRRRREGMPKQVARRHPPLLQPLLSAQLAWSRPEGKHAQLSVELPSERLHELHVCDQQAPLDARVVKHKARAPGCARWLPMLPFMNLQSASSGRAGDEQPENYQRCE